MGLVGYGGCSLGSWTDMHWRVLLGLASYGGCWLDVQGWVLEGLVLEIIVWAAGCIWRGVY